MAELLKFKQYLDQAGREVDVDFDVRDCNWSHVIELLQRADDAVAKRVERDKAFLSKGGRVLTDISGVLQSVLEALPDELCVLNGGLSLLFHVSDSIINLPSISLSPEL